MEGGVQITPFVRPHGPTDVAAALLDVSQPFDDELLERLNGWIAGTTGTPYEPPRPRTGAADESIALSSSIWPSASFSAPSAAAGAPATSPVRTAAAVPSVSIRWSPPRLGRHTPASASSTFGLLSGASRRVLPETNDESPVAMRSPALSRAPYRAEVFDFPTGAVLGDVVLIQARCRSWKARRFMARYRALLTRRMSRETAATYQAWQFVTHATRTRLKALKRAAFFALRDYTRLTVRLFSSVAIYLERMLGRTEYSASSMWNLAQRQPVPGLEHLSTMPTYLYTSIFSRLYRQYSERLIKRLKLNLRYWKAKRASAKGMWKASFRQRSRAVLIVWFRYGKLIIAERTLQSIPVFEEQIPEWDVCFEHYMKTASTMRKVASLSVQNVLRRSFRRLLVYLGRPGSKSQQVYAEEHFVRYGQRQCLQGWAELKNRGIAEQFFFHLVFRRWQRQARDAFYSLRMLERQLSKWVCQRNCRRCFRAMQAYKDYSLMMSYAATQRIRSPNEHAVVLKVVFQWRGQTWHVAMVHCWDSWRKFTWMRRAFSTFVTRHSIARRDELLLISFLAFHRYYRAALKAAEKDAREAAAVAGKDPKAVQCKQVGPLDRKYEMDACEDHGEVDAKTVEQAIEQFPDDDFDTAIQHHRKITFAQWKETPDKSLLKRVFTFQMHHKRAEVQADAEQGANAVDVSRPSKNRPTEKQRLIDAKVAMKAAEQKFGSREEAQLHFRRELRYATEVRSSAENSHADIIERHAFRFENAKDDNTAIAESKPKKTSKKARKNDPFAGAQVSTDKVDDTIVGDSTLRVEAERQRKSSKADVRDAADAKTVSFEAQGDRKQDNAKAHVHGRESDGPQSAQNHAGPSKKSMDSGRASLVDGTPTNSESTQQSPTEYSPSSVPGTEDQNSQQTDPRTLSSHEGAHAPPERRSDIAPATTSSKRKSKKKSRAKEKNKVPDQKQRSGDHEANLTSQDIMAMPETELSGPASQEETAVETPAEPKVDLQNDALAVDAVQSMTDEQRMGEEQQLEVKEATVPTTDSVPEHGVQQSPEHTPLSVEDRVQQGTLSPVGKDMSEPAAVVDTSESSPTPVLAQDLVFREPGTFDHAEVVGDNMAHTNELGGSSETVQAFDSGDRLNTDGLGSEQVSVTGPADDDLPDGFANAYDSEVGGAKLSPRAVMDIEVPEGIEPGEPMILNTSEGQQIEVIVPEGMRPGDVFQATIAGAKHHSGASPEVVQFTVPTDAEAGHVVVINSRHTGRNIEIIVPEGVNPGDTFPVSLARVHEQVGARLGEPAYAESESAAAKQPAVDEHDPPDQAEDDSRESISDAWGPSDGPTQTHGNLDLELEPKREKPGQQPPPTESLAQTPRSSARAELLGISAHLPEMELDNGSLEPDAGSVKKENAKHQPDNRPDINLTVPPADTTPTAGGDEDATPTGDAGAYAADVPNTAASSATEKTGNLSPAESHPTELQDTAARRDTAGNEEPAVAQVDQQQHEDENAYAPDMAEAAKIPSQENANSRTMASADTQSEPKQSSAKSADTAAPSTESPSDSFADRSSVGTDGLPRERDEGIKSAEPYPAEKHVPANVDSQEERLGSPGAAASRALQREDAALAHNTTTAADAFSGASVLDMSSEELDAVRRSELELLQRLKDIAHSNRELSDMDEDLIKNALEKDLLKFKGPDIYERNTYRAKINEQALKSRVRKDQLYWLYQQAELALERHASEVSHIPLDQFKIPVTGPLGFSRDQPNIDVGSRDKRPASTYDNLASYFAQVKEHLAARGQQGAETGWADRPSTVATSQGVTEEMSRLSSRFPSLAQRAPESRPRRPNTAGDGRRSRDTNSREGRTTHAADISLAAVSAWGGGSGITPSESYLYSADGSAAMFSTYAGARPDCGHPLHSSMSCPGCGSAEHIAEVQMHTPSTGALTAVNLNRLREKAEDPSKYHLERTIDGDEAPSHLTKAEQEEEFRRAHYGGGGAAGRGRQHGKPRAGLTPGVLRPNGMLPPLETDMQLTGMSQSQSAVTVGSNRTDASTMHLDSAMQSQFSLTGENGSQPSIRRRKRPKKKAWKSPYRPTDEEDAEALRPRRTTPSFGGGDDISGFEMSGAGLRVPPHLLDLIGHVEEMLDNGDVEAALEHITSSFVGQ